MTVHHLMVGTWLKPGAIYTIAFDDEQRTLELVKKTEIPHDEPLSWITFDHAKKNIYGAGMKKWGSYSVNSPTDIIHHSSHSLGGHPQAADPDTKTRAIFVLAAQKPPYCVYGNPFYDHAGFGNVFSTNEDGSIKSNIQNYEYSPQTAVHGMVFDPTETYLYSADMWANKVWTHRKAPDGTLALVGSIDAPDPGDHPRWVEMSPNGKYLWALMEAGNRLCEYKIDVETHQPVYTQRSWPLIPPGWNERYPKMYRSDNCVISHSGKYLFAGARSNDTKVHGYMATFRIADDGSIEKQLIFQPTPTSGGHSNAVSPCPWTDQWVALTDDTVGRIEIYRFHMEQLHHVARLDISDPGFCMNAIWYD